jgi:hypothetical protein
MSMFALLLTAAIVSVCAIFTYVLVRGDFDGRPAPGRHRFGHGPRRRAF